MVALVVHPGRLTAEFRDGLRIRSISPWRLTFNMVALFFVLSIVTDFRIANFPKHDPSGKLADALSVAAQQANIDKVTLVDRADRFFHAIYTLLVTLSIGTSAVVARATHPRNREPWSVHFVFALHLTAWSFVANLAYYVVLRLFGLSPYMTTSDANSQVAGVSFLVLLLLWTYGYVLLAFRRVYADGWLGAGAKAAVLVLVGLVAGNVVVILSLWLAVKMASQVA